MYKWVKFTAATFIGILSTYILFTKQPKRIFSKSKLVDLIYSFLLLPYRGFYLLICRAETLYWSVCIQWKLLVTSSIHIGNIASS